jgi:putative PIN family toxin of toxin-antitoxin system
VRVLLDTNVVVAAFATRGLCEDLLRAVLAEHELVVAARVLIELERALVVKPKMPARRAREVVAFVRSQGDVIAPERPAVWPQRDRDDRWIVAAAIEGRADVLVTGDRDLLEDAQEAPLPIVSPRGFWERLR